MRIGITGASGLLGTALSGRLEGLGHEVLALVRHEPARPGEVRWDPSRRILESAALEELDAVVHLAGEPIAAGRWTPSKRARIRDSRVEGTGLLAHGLAGLSRPPRVLLCASATGYYGERGDEVCAEDDPAGQGFLAETCLAWERAADPAREAGITTLHFRIGMVLTTAGGALARMLPFFRLGLGGPLSHGNQYWSWIALEDLVNLFLHYLTRESPSGAINAVAPEPARSRDFARELGRVLHRPAFFPVPRLALRVVLGSMTDELLLTSTRAVPLRAQSEGFAFARPDLSQALRRALAKSR